MTRKSIFICTPAFMGKVNESYAISLADTVLMLDRQGITTKVIISKSGSLLCQERNRLLNEFIKSSCTHVLCIDSDIAWNPDSVMQMINADKDFIAACYSARQENIFLFKPVFNEDKSLKIVDGRFIEMNNIPAGFMLIKRHVIEKMIADTPEDAIIPTWEKEEPKHCLFETKMKDHKFWGEDFIFCEKARNSGFTILVDPNVVLDHDGKRAALIETLTEDKSKSAHHQQAQEITSQP